MVGAITKTARHDDNRGASKLVDDFRAESAASEPGFAHKGVPIRLCIANRWSRNLSPFNIILADQKDIEALAICAKPRPDLLRTLAVVDGFGENDLPLEHAVG